MKIVINPFYIRLAYQPIMDEEIKQLQARIQELEQKKREEDERNKDPFRFLRGRIEKRNKLISYYDSQITHALHNNLNAQQFRDGITGQTHENNCDLSIIQAFEKLQAQVEELRTAPTGDLLG